MDIRNSKIKSKSTIIRTGLLVCMGFILLSEMAFGAQVTASLLKRASNDQRLVVSVDFENEPLANVLHELARKVDVGISYKTDILSARLVTYRAANKSIYDVLNTVLEGTGLYAILSKNRKVILIKQRFLQKVAKLQSTISGTVTDAGTGETMPGVNIQVKGTTTGTSTDSQGQYELTVESLQDTLVFSFVGYQTRQVSINGRTEINIEMQSQVFTGEEMVVTALGINRKSRSLGYSVDKVEPEEITVNSTANFANALQGKLAGVNISPPSTGPQGSSKIRIRGQSSFGANNSPLIIVNGTPINNTNFGVNGSSNLGEHHNSDSGDGLSSIDPDDIESMNVLKGAAASALYGSRASNGVILITTKNRAEGSGIQLEYNSNFKYETPLDFRNYQYQYGQGEHGTRPTNPFPVSGQWSFGEKFEPGMTQILFDGLEVPYEPQRNQLKDYYRNGFNLNNTVTVSSGGENGGFSISLSNLKTQSIQPNSNYERNNITLGFTQTLADRLTVSGNVNYAKENRNNPPNVAEQDYSPVVIYNMANSMPMDVLKENCCDEMGNEILYSRFTDRTNPYFALKRFENNDRDRLFGNITAQYDFTDWLSLRGRIGQDYYYRNVDYNIPTGSQRDAPAPLGYVNGQYVQDQQSFREINADFLLTFNKTFGNYGVDVNFGGNQMIRNVDEKNIVVNDFFQRGVYTIGNGRTKDPNHNLTKKQTNSLYGSAEISYKEMLYLTGTARNDWFSTLSPGNRSILYPSITASFVFSDALALPEWITFGKIRASYAQVGSDTDVAPYSDQLFYSINTNLYRNSPVGSISGSTLPNTNLHPSHVDEYDLGIQMTVFENYSFEIGYYNKTTSDQILNQQISNASGFSTRQINAAKSKNEGIEMSLNAGLIHSKNFTWNLNANASYNKSKVLSLGDGLDEITVGNAYFHGELRQVVGQPIDQLYGKGWLRDEQGRRVFDPDTGIPLFTDNLVSFGSSLPNWTGGFTNNFNYKDLSLSFLITFKLGNNLVSGTDINAYRHGLDKRTLAGRDQGYVIGDGVNPDGSENTTHAEIQSFYESIRGARAVEQSVYNGGSWQLKQISLGYDLTSVIPKGLHIRALKLNFVASNVLVLKKWVPHIHPDQNPVISDRLEGLVPTGLPVTRGFGLNLNVKF